jgi:hypothetical protein
MEISILFNSLSIIVLDILFIINIYSCIKIAKRVSNLEMLVNELKNEKK